MTEFWEEAFKDKKDMWGHEPAASAVWAAGMFAEKGIRTVLIPGIGYGRNARPFVNRGMTVKGIEISQTAISIAQQHTGPHLDIHHGSVTDMPVDNDRYDGIFCYAVIHLLDQDERAKLIRDCYTQLSEGGYMVFTTISKAASTYGQGTCIGPDRFEMFGGVKMYFYDRQSLQDDFRDAGLLDISEIEETYPFYLISCQKKGKTGTGTQQPAGSGTGNT